MPGPGEDLLTMVIGPEHPGRTRAVGHDVGLRIGMQGPEKKKRKTFHDKESEAISSLKATLDIAMSQLAEVNAKLAMQDLSNQVPSDCGSKSTMDALDPIKVLLLLKLLVVLVSICIGLF